MTTSISPSLQSHSHATICHGLHHLAAQGRLSRRLALDTRLLSSVGL